MNVFDLWAQISLDSSDFDNGLDAAEGKAEGFGSKLKDGLATAAKVGTAAITAASAAIGVLTKQSIDGYGEYEQLTGGVETLFKDSADVVMGNANNAYKTAGLSANEYMETVTSFSASLLQSLNNDTAKAAEVADVAITDMSDNANKMGSSMESIQNAYQGFAKQNYTMLDNLKLGYGGTKEEMQRLLGDAEKLSGQKFDLSSYSDIVEAIHVVQTEMGITGTTAKEASTTIQGSVNTAKSAWKNLVVGIADENADLDTLISDFIDSVAVAGENLLPRIEQILTGIGSALQTLAPIIAEKVPEILTTVLPSIVSAGAQLIVGLITGIAGALPELVSAIPDMVMSIVTAISESLPSIIAAGQELLSMFTDGILSALPGLVEAVGGIITTLTDTFVEYFPDVVNTGFDILNQVVDGIVGGLPDMISRLPAIIDGFLNFITENLPTILDKGVELLNKLVNGIIGAIPDLLAALPQIITSFTKFIGENLPKIVDAGIKLLMNLVKGIVKTIPELIKALPSIIAAIVTGIGNQMGGILEIGKNIVMGIWEGISGMASWIGEKVSGFFGGIVDGVKGLLGIHSPSTVFADMGKNMALGLGEGWNNEFSSIQKDIENGLDFGTAEVDFASSGLAMANRGLAGDIISAASAGDSMRDIVINITSSLDGAILARNMVRYNKAAERNQGPSLVST